MPTVTTSTERRDGVTYVAVRIDNRIEDPVVDAHSIRLQTDARPIWAPAAERPRWADGVATVDVPVGTVRGVGFATPRAPADCSVEVDEVRPATDESTGGSPSPRTVLRALGDPRPPRDVVPIDTGSGAEQTHADQPPSEGEDSGTAPDRIDTDQPSTRPTGGTEDRASTSGSVTPARQEAFAGTAGLPQDVAAILEPDADPPAGDQGPAPAPVEQWLAAVEERIGSDSAAVRTADRAHLRRVEQKVASLLERIESAEGAEPVNEPVDGPESVEGSAGPVDDGDDGFDWIGGDRTTASPEVRE